MMGKPKIRFKGYNEEDWEQRKVSDMFKVARGYVLPATDTSQEMTDEIPYPVYSSQTKDNGLMGYYQWTICMKMQLLGRQTVLMQERSISERESSIVPMFVVFCCLIK